jgi:peptide/nickel transport system substrate-binding protein
LVLAACSNGGEGEMAAIGTHSTPETPVPGGTLIRHLSSECKTLNWVLYNTTPELYVLRYLYDYLLDYDKDLEIIPVLAESYEVSKDNLQITVRLRPNLTWHDGHPITSEDIKFTYDRIVDPAVPAVNKEGWFNRLKDVEIVDDLTVVFVWSEQYAPALHAIARFAPIPKHIYGKGDFMSNPANRAPIGSGAFKFEEWKSGQMITLVRNDDYYRENAYLDRIIFRSISDNSAAFSALRAGEIDEMAVRQAQWETQTGDKEFEAMFNKQVHYVPQYNYLAWNCRSEWFKDRRVRKAMSLLFDRPTLNDKLYSGYARLVSGPFYVNSWAYDQSIEPLPFDRRAAAQLLEEAGWIDNDTDGVRERNGIDFEFEFYVPSGSTIAMEFATLLQESCKKVGIVVKIRQLERATYFDKVFKGEYTAAAQAWRLDHDPDIYDTFHTSQVPPFGLNHAFYSNLAVDSLLELGRREFDREKRQKIYHEVHRLIHEDQPYTFVNSVPEKRPINKRIGNVTLSPDGPFKFYPGAIYWYIKSDIVEAKK